MNTNTNMNANAKTNTNTYKNTNASQGDALGPPWPGTPYLQAGIELINIAITIAVVIAIVLVYLCFAGNTWNFCSPKCSPSLEIIALIR